LPERFFPIFGNEDPKEVQAAKWDYDQLRNRKRRVLTTDDSQPNVTVNIASKSNGNSNEKS
jgi:hypothetical protein